MLCPNCKTKNILETNKGKGLHCPGCNENFDFDGKEFTAASIPIKPAAAETPAAEEPKPDRTKKRFAEMVYDWFKSGDEF